MTVEAKPGAPMPQLYLPLVGGGTVHIGGPRSAFQVVIVYRGCHCSICKRYLAELQSAWTELREANAEVVAVSADPEERASADVEDGGWTFPVAYGLTPDQMRRLGLHISAPRSPAETDRPFAEPAAFVVNPAGAIQVVCRSNAPWVRPQVADLLYAVRRIQAVDYPIRGTLE